MSTINRRSILRQALGTVAFSAAALADHLLPPGRRQDGDLRDALRRAQPGDILRVRGADSMGAIYVDGGARGMRVWGNRFQNSAIQVNAVPW